MSKVDKGGAQQTSLLDVLKKKMRQAREEAEAAKDEADEVKRHLEEERKKREDVGDARCPQAINCPRRKRR
jgi:outer membrane murein-binding lipoprotein Lpp